MKHKFRVLVDTIGGGNTSGSSYRESWIALGPGENKSSAGVDDYYFIDTDVELSLSASEAFSRLSNKMYQCDYTNSPLFTGSAATGGVMFLDNNRWLQYPHGAITGSLIGSEQTGSIKLTAIQSNGRILKRYKFFGEKVCNVLGFPHDLWIYPENAVLSNTGSEESRIVGNLQSKALAVTNVFQMSNISTVASDIPFRIDKTSDRWVRWLNVTSSDGIDQNDMSLGYNSVDDRYEFKHNLEATDMKDLNISASAIYLTGSTEAMDSVWGKGRIYSYTGFETLAGGYIRLNSTKEQIHAADNRVYITAGASNSAQFAQTSVTMSGNAIVSDYLLVGQTSKTGYGGVTADSNDMIVNGQFSAGGSAGSAIYKLQVGDTLGIPTGEGDLNVSGKVTMKGASTFQGDVTVAGKISGSATTTGSLSHLWVHGDDMWIGQWSGSHTQPEMRLITKLRANNQYGFSDQFGSGVAIVNEQGTKNQVIFLGDVENAHASATNQKKTLFGIATSIGATTNPSNPAGNWEQKFKITAQGKVRIGTNWGTNDDDGVYWLDILPSGSNDISSTDTNANIRLKTPSGSADLILDGNQNVFNGSRGSNIYFRELGTTKWVMGVDMDGGEFCIGPTSNSWSTYAKFQLQTDGTLWVGDSNSYSFGAYAKVASANGFFAASKTYYFGITGAGNHDYIKYWDNAWKNSSGVFGFGADQSSSLNNSGSMNGAIMAKDGYFNRDLYVDDDIVVGNNSKLFFGTSDYLMLSDNNFTVYVGGGQKFTVTNASIQSKHFHYFTYKATSFNANINISDEISLSSSAAIAAPKLYLRTHKNNTGASIDFSDHNDGTFGQKGQITYYHADSRNDLGKGAIFELRGTHAGTEGLGVVITGSGGSGHSSELFTMGDITATKILTGGTFGNNSGTYFKLKGRAYFGNIASAEAGVEINYGDQSTVPMRIIRGTTNDVMWFQDGALTDTPFTFVSNGYGTTSLKNKLGWQWWMGSNSPSGSIFELEGSQGHALVKKAGLGIQLQRGTTITYGDLPLKALDVDCATGNKNPDDPKNNMSHQNGPLWRRSAASNANANTWMQSNLAYSDGRQSVVGPAAYDDNVYFYVQDHNSDNTYGVAIDGSSVSFTGQHLSNLKSDSSLLVMDWKGAPEDKLGVSGSNIADYVGLIVYSTGEYRSWNKEKMSYESGSEGIMINSSLPVIDMTATNMDKRVFGVISNQKDNPTLDNDTGKYQLDGEITSTAEGGGGMDMAYAFNQLKPGQVRINSIGEGAVWICNISGALENGDYITTCEVPGHGCKQNDDLIHNYTLGKITQDCNFDLNSTKYKCEEFEYSGSTYRKAFVGCTYHCG